MFHPSDLPSPEIFLDLILMWVMGLHPENDYLSGLSQHPRQHKAHFSLVRYLSGHAEWKDMLDKVRLAKYNDEYDIKFWDVSFFFLKF